jgi:hypothetical protein
MWLLSRIRKWLPNVDEEILAIVLYEFAFRGDSILAVFGSCG